MEIWRAVKGFEKLYEVSNYGNVKSLNRKIIHNGSFNGFINIKERILKQTTNRLGYKVLILFKDGKRNFKIVHRLVAESFIDNPNNYLEVNHKDLNKSNNHVSNLEWCNRSQNVSHFFNNKKKTSKHKGVSYQLDRKKWVSYFDLNGKRITIGRFNSEEEAKKARDKYINEIKTIDNESII